MLRARSIPGTGIISAIPTTACDSHQISLKGPRVDEQNDRQRRVPHPEDYPADRIPLHRPQVPSIRTISSMPLTIIVLNPILTRTQTYGIPTISTLPLKTSQFSNSSTSFKRYADTGTLIDEFMAFDPVSECAQTAIARTKFLHQGYCASGKILEDDMLYTLNLFATEPIRFVRQYEWRSITEMKRCAVGTYWKSLGDALKTPIGKEGLPGWHLLAGRDQYLES